MADDSPPPADPHGPEFRRQKALLFALAGVLMLGGIVVLAFLRRIPLPLRLAAGLGDFIAAAALLLLLRQKFSGATRGD